MKKIKLFLITLLCMVGVMNVAAQDKINSTDNALKNGNVFVFQWVQENPQMNGVYAIVSAKNARVVGTDGKNYVGEIAVAGDFVIMPNGNIKCGDTYLLPGNLGGLNDNRAYTIGDSKNQGGVTGRKLSFDFLGTTSYLCDNNSSVGYYTIGLFSRERNDGSDLWNFYSVEQIVCYLEFKEAYKALISLQNEELTNEQRTDLTDYISSLITLCDNKGGYKGNSSTERETTNQKTAEIWDFIYSLKGSDSGEGAVGPDDLIINPDGNEVKRGWHFERLNADGEYMGIGAHSSDNGWRIVDNKPELYFDLRNASMKQTVRGLKNGIWRLSCYFQADDQGSQVELKAITSAHEKTTGKVSGTGISGGDVLGELGYSAWGWHELTTPDVVVIDGRLEINASAITPQDQKSHWCNIDHFRLEYICANRMTEQADGTRLFEGVYDGVSGDKDPENAFEVTDNFPYADVKGAYYAKAYNPTLIHTNPNGLFYARANDTKVSDNNVIKDGTCANLVLSDGHPYSAKADFTATNASYEMEAVGLDENTGNKWGSLMLPYDSKIPNGISAWTLKVDSDGETLKLSPIENGVIPANTAVLVSNTGFFTATGVDVLNGQAGEYKQGGDLTGVYKSKYAPVGSYVLQKHGKRVEYYLVETENLSLVKPFRSYLTDPEGNARSMSFEIIYDETDGISNVEFECEDGAIYDMSGRRVQQLVRGGIYIFNGKKILVK